MNLSLFDLHCDTAYEMHRQRQPLTSNSLTISLENAEKFDQYLQVMAIWTDSHLSDEDGWSAFQQIHRNLCSDQAIFSGKAKIGVRCPEKKEFPPTLLLGVEDARICNENIDRIDTLWSMGVRFLTPIWKGETCIGGSHDTKSGLTEFGKQAMTQAIRLGMLVDISHASEQSAYDLFAIAAQYNRPILATHSNSYDVCPVSRNLHRWQAEAIQQCDGVVGLNLYPPFLQKEREARLENLIPHIEYFLELGLEKHLCLGCDMDGAAMPPEIQNLSDLPKLAELLLRRNYSEEFINQLFFANAYRFAKQYLNI